MFRLAKQVLYLMDRYARHVLQVVQRALQVRLSVYHAIQASLNQGVAVWVSAHLVILVTSPQEPALDVIQNAVFV